MGSVKVDVPELLWLVIALLVSLGGPLWAQRRQLLSSRAIPRSGLARLPVPPSYWPRRLERESKRFGVRLLHDWIKSMSNESRNKSSVNGDMVVGMNLLLLV